MANIVIGIEGLVGSGKTSICRKLKNKLPNSIIFHGGNLYRGIVYALINKDEDISNNLELLSIKLKNVDITEVMKALNVEVKLENNETVIFANGKKVDEEELQSKKTSMAVSIAARAANNKNLFLFAGNLIDEWKKDYNVILSGRSNMKIYPNLDYQFFITASIDERVNRKYKQYEGKMTKEELKAHIEKRDKLQEESGFYEIYDNTIMLDVTDCKDAEESCDKLLKSINKELLTV